MATLIEQVEPLLVHCTKCERQWSLGWLPMPMESVAVLLKHAKCASGHPRKFIHMGPIPKATPEGDPIAWLDNGDTGVSSKTIWFVMMGRASSVREHFDVPHDHSDFGRCYRLLQVMPSWRARLSEVSARFPEWAPLVDAWDELTALYEEEAPKKLAPKLYKRIQELRGDERD